MTRNDSSIRQTVQEISSTSPKNQMPRKGRVAWLILLVILPLTLAASEFLATTGHRAVQSSATRLGWYFRSGQWRADVRTLAAAMEFLTDEDPDSAGQGKGK